MATRQLWLLGVPRLQLIADAVEKLHVALLWVLLESRDKGPRHGSGGLGSDCSISPVDDCVSELASRPGAITSLSFKRKKRKRRRNVSSSRCPSLRCLK